MPDTTKSAPERYRELADTWDPRAAKTVSERERKEAQDIAASYRDLADALDRRLGNLTHPDYTPAD